MEARCFHGTVRIHVHIILSVLDVVFVHTVFVLLILVDGYNVSWCFAGHVLRPESLHLGQAILGRCKFRFISHIATNICNVSEKMI